MKVQELLENEQQKVVFRSDDFDEYNQFLNKEAGQDNRYHYEEISPEGSEELFDIIIEVFNYQRSPETRHDPEDIDIDWDIVLYGTGDFDTDTGFYFVSGTFNLPQKVHDDIEQRLIEDQDQKGQDDYYDRGEYEADMRREEEI